MEEAVEVEICKQICKYIDPKSKPFRYLYPERIFWIEYYLMQHGAAIEKWRSGEWFRVKLVLGDGRSWVSAKKTIEDAISTATLALFRAEPKFKEYDQWGPPRTFGEKKPES